MVYNMLQSSTVHCMVSSKHQGFGTSCCQKHLRDLVSVPFWQTHHFGLGKYKGAFVYVTPVVDDLLVTSPNVRATLSVIEELKSKIPCKHMDIAPHYIGMLISWLPAKKAVIL
jgi:hypothetical protein